MDKILSTSQPLDIRIDGNLLKKTFLEHLNYIYYGKHHLLDFFAEVETIATLNVLKHAIQECVSDTKTQITDMDEVYSAIAASPSKTNTLGIKAMTLEAWIGVIKTGKTPMERDVYILFYLQQIEGIEVTYYKVLKNLAKCIGYDHRFLNQPFDLAVENKLLFESIYDEYIS